MEVHCKEKVKVKVGQIILSWNIANSQTNTLVGVRNIEYVTPSFDDNRTQVDIK